MTKKTGTREWAEVNVNIILGCEHRCRYCYAAEGAERRGQISSPRRMGNVVLPREARQGR